MATSPLVCFRSVAFLFCAPIAMYHVPSSVLAETTYTVEELSKKCLTYRRNLNSGILTITTTRRDLSGESLADQSTFRAAFDKTRLRCDMTTSSRVTYRNIITPSECIEYCTFTDGQGRRMVVDIRDSTVSAAPMTGVFHPLVIGMHAGSPSHWHSHSEDALLKVSKSCKRSLNYEPETDLYHIVNSYANGSRADIWISAEKGFSIVKATVNAVRDGKSPLIDTAACELSQFDSVWFPSRVYWTRTQDGKLLMDQTVAIESANFNCEINESEFSVAGMDVPPGTSIKRTPPYVDGPKMWDGHNIVSSNAEDYNVAPVRNWWSLLYWIWLPIVVVGGAIYLSRFLRSRQTIP